MKLTAVKRFHRTKAGESFSVHAAVGRALIALGYARLPDVQAPKKTLTLPKDKKAEQQTGTYQRRDLTAEAKPVPVPAMREEYWTKPRS